MKINDFFSVYLPGVSFFLFLYTIIYIVTWDSSITLFLSLFAVFSLVYILDCIIPWKWVFALISMLLLGFWALLWMPDMFIVTGGALVYSSYPLPELRASGFRGLRKSRQAAMGTDLSGRQRVYYWGYDEKNSFKVGRNKIWIILISVAAVVIGFVEPHLLSVVLRNLALACVFDIICRQSIRSNSFFRSYYSKGITKNMVNTLVKRGYKLILPITLCLIILGGIALMPSFPRPVMPDLDLNPNLRNVDIRENRLWDFSFNFFDDTDFEGPDRQQRRGFDRVVSNIFYYASVAVAVGAAIALLVFVFLLIYKRRKKKHTVFDDYDELVEVVDVKEDDKGKRIRSRFMVFGVNNAVRRVFIKKVREHVRQEKISKPKKSDTPKKLVTDIQKTESVDVLDSLYHKARYSEAEITRSELKDLKRNI